MNHGVAAVSAPPTRYEIPRIRGEPDAAYQLAAAYRDLAEAVTASHRQVGLIIGHLSRAWRGEGQAAINAPLETFLRQSAQLAHVLLEVAGEPDAYGRRLASAHHHHGWSLGKMLKVATIVAVSATAIVVTVGAAAAVEAAAATAAVGSATVAAGDAMAADATAAATMGSAMDAMSVLRPLLTFVVPHLTAVEWNVAAMATYDEATTSRLRWRGMAEVASVAFVGDSATTQGGELVNGPWLPHVVQGTGWAGAAAADDALIEHRIDLPDIAESFVLAGGSSAGHDALKDHGWWPAEPDYHRNALVALVHQDGYIADPKIAHELAVLRQSAHEFDSGAVDLRVNEGPGHTVNRHVGKSAGELLSRVRTTRIRVASTYWDEAGAREAVERTLRTNHGVVKGWVAAGCPDTLRLRMTVPYDLGFAVDRKGTVRFVRQAVVVLRRDHAGIVLVTSYPVR